MRVCTACARTTEESGRFCPDCGAAFETSGSAGPRSALQGSAEVIAELGSAQTHVSGLEAAQPAPASSSSASKLIGMTIDGQFQIESVLGGGAFGTVYRGRQLGLDRPVAIKVPTYEIAADPVMAKRFAREARSAARVQHPGIVAIYAVGELADGRPYLAMQYVDGQSLDKIIDDGPIDAVRALSIARSIASALSETHAADVVHRDLKPSNIVWRLDRNGDDRMTLVDFGIAVCKPGNADATRLTADGLIGTPHYMSPEQAHGDQVDARADLYALGCILFELVTGSPPFEGSGFEVLLAHLGRPAPLPSERNPGVPQVVDRLCAALMAKKPDDRPQHADEVVALLDEAIIALGGRASKPARAPRKPAKQTRPPPARSLETRFDLPEGSVVPRQRRRSRRLVLGLAALALGAGGSFVALEMRGSDRAVADPLADPAVDSDPRVGRRRSLFKDNGEMRVHALVPDPLIAKQEIRARLDIKNKLGMPVVADEVVLTIADDSGAAKGLTARPRTPRRGESADDIKGRYYFRHTFPAPGRYTLRVFPPSIDSSFEIPVDVE